MKRKISLFLILAVLFTALASPASAQEISNDIGFQVLDYATVNNSGSNFIAFNGIVTNTLSLPETYYAQYIDMVFTMDGEPVTHVQSIWQTTVTELQIVHIGGNLYRAYGNIRSAQYDVLTIRMLSANSSNRTWIQLKSCVLRSSWFHFDSDAYCSISSYGFNDVIHYVSTDDINHRQLPAVNNFAYAGYQLSIWTDNWRKYDYIDYNLYLVVDSITSISCYINGDTVVPFTVSYIDNDSMTVNSFAITIRVDLTGINRNLDSNPVVIIEGNQFTVGVETASSWIYFNGCSGFVDTDSELTWYRDLKANLSEWLSPLVGMLEDLMTSMVTNFNLLRSDISDRFTWLKNWISEQTATLEAAIRGDSSPGDSFQDDVAEKDQQFDDMAAVMDSVNKPSLDSINVNVDQYVAPADITLLTSPLLVFLTGDIFGPIIIMTLMLATVSYVLYGKRG